MHFGKGFLDFWTKLYLKRKIIFQMALEDFHKQYTGSFLGIIWAFIQPLVFVLTLWFVFAIGLRQARGQEPVPFVIWLMTGMFFWFFFSEILQTGAGVIREKSYLVKNVRFEVSMLPVIKILSALLVHLVFVILLAVLLIFNGISPQLHWLQTGYYLLAAIMLSLGTCWITAALNVFVKDIRHLTQIIIRIGFWFTPIFWKADHLPGPLKTIVKLNPAFYLIQGYRDSLIYKTWFWERPALTLYFWMFTFIILFLGAVIFRRLSPHFADVL
jgi:lipopolysaccharide transport system permease protein/teichoic acid transport system permease protein